MKLSYLAKRPVERTIWQTLKPFYSLTSGRYFNITSEGVENLPNDSAIIAQNHSFAFDGLFTSLALPKQIHYFIQREKVYERNIWNHISFWALGLLPVHVDSKMSREDYQSFLRAQDYLKSFPDLVGIFIDGPAKELKIDGKIIPKEEREVKPGASALYFRVNQDINIPIIPVGTWLPERIAKQLWQADWQNRGVTNSYLRRLLEREGRIDYQVRVGKPIYSSDKRLQGLNKNEKKEVLEETLKQEIIRLSQAP